jgi:apolipoprotein N-acyltransferase
MFSLQRYSQPLVAVVAAVLLALSFPTFDAAWLAPIGAGALFWAFGEGSWRRAFFSGWLAGVVFFCISFAWWSHTIGHSVGPFWAGAAVFLGAVDDGSAWALSGALFVLARRYAPPAWTAVAGAAAFTIAEWLRSIGPGGAPFAQLGYTQADTPLRIFAAYAGTYGVTFVLCVIGAIAADAVRRRTLRPAGIAAAAIVVAWLGCWLVWPARHAATPTIPVAAIQGNIVQTIKWEPGSLALAVQRYTSMTQAVVARHPRLIVWPETVIAIRAEGLNLDSQLERRFATLAAATHATLVVGSIEQRDSNTYNALFFYDPRGGRSIYEKRQLVPFAEDFPLAKYLYWFPFVGKLNGGFSAGTTDGVYPTAAGLLAAPLICWESAFADRLHAQIARGAQIVLVSTDDAWFGETAGPYQDAQISQLRAIENGTWLVRAAATGVSGIIAPDGDWTQRSAMDTQTAVVGVVGPPPGSLFARIGPTPVIVVLVLLYLAIVVTSAVRARRHDA